MKTITKLSTKLTTIKNQNKDKKGIKFIIFERIGRGCDMLKSLAIMFFYVSLQFQNIKNEMQ